MNRDRDIQRAVAKKRENQGFDGVVKRLMQVGEKSFDEVDVGVIHSTSVFDVEEVAPFLQTGMKTLTGLLTRSVGGNIANGDARMAGNVSQQPKDLVATELGNQVFSERTVLQIGRATGESLMKDLIIEFPVIMAMLGQVGVP